MKSVEYYRFLFGCVLSAIVEAGSESVPESTVYLGLNCDMRDYEIIRGLLLSTARNGSRIATIQGHAITLTPYGVELGKNCSQILGKDVA